ncbi:MAG: hypothetical protein KZQ93_03740 [Candidatus Thiodiazotropha sp. (ex Monitilora ramsayi)]|nr:hypothetical protein [Candidatus Thiodiazotropha sp. (ex Monitilora ramsayi)]
MKIITTLLIILLSSFTHSNAAENILNLGVMSHDCSSFKPSDNKANLPEYFKLTPVEAAKTVKANSKYGCFIKMGIGVYTDGNYYYFANNNLLFGKSVTFELIKQYSFVVNPNTGNLISKPKYEDNT